MPFRVGITTDQESRKEDWESQYPNLRNWRINSYPHKTKAEAQVVEDREARRLGRQSHGGGDDPNVPGKQW